MVSRIDWELYALFPNSNHIEQISFSLFVCVFSSVFIKTFQSIYWNHVVRDFLLGLQVCFAKISCGFSIHTYTHAENLYDDDDVKFKVIAIHFVLMSISCTHCVYKASPCKIIPVVCVIETALCQKSLHTGWQSCVAGWLYKCRWVSRESPNHTHTTYFIDSMLIF